MIDAGDNTYGGKYVVNPSGGGSHAFNAGERCYNCGQYGHWYVESRNKEGGVARRRIHVADVFSFF